jgi:hypothetical protein
LSGAGGRCLRILIGAGVRCLGTRFWIESWRLEADAEDPSHSPSPGRTNSTSGFLAESGTAFWRVGVGLEGSLLHSKGQGIDGKVV